MSLFTTPFSKVLVDDPRLAKVYNALSFDFPSIEEVKDTTSACLHLGRLLALTAIAHDELVNYISELGKMQAGELAAIVPLEITLTQVEEGRWMAEVLAMPGVYANAASKQEAIEDVREAALYAIANYQADQH